jgi:hypothetical protein
MSNLCVSINRLVLSFFCSLFRNFARGDFSSGFESGGSHKVPISLYVAGKIGLTQQIGCMISGNKSTF